MNPALRRQISKMSSGQRLALISEIWETIPDEEGLLPVTSDEIEMINERLAEMERNPGGNMTFEAFNEKLEGLKAKLKSRRRKRAS